MLLIISNDKSKLLKAIKSSPFPVFAYFLGESDPLDTSNYPLGINAIVIDSDESLERLRKLCVEVKSRISKVSVGVILNHSLIQTAMFRYIPEADEELLSSFSNDDLFDFLKRLHHAEISSPSPSLFYTENKVFLLGYDMKLSPLEHRIVLFLSRFCESRITVDDICGACLNTREGADRARVFISRINKKAMNISSRHLILRSAEKGYYINPNA